MSFAANERERGDGDESNTVSEFKPARFGSFHLADGPHSVGADRKSVRYT